MRGAQDAYVEGDHLRPAHAYQFPFLKHAQQPPLKGKRQVPDFVEEQVPVWASSNMPALP